MKTPILGSAYVARSVNAADNRMINLFPEIVPEGGPEPAFLNRAPGLRLLATIGTGPIRGVWALGDYLYIISGYYLYKSDSLYNFTLLGSILGTGPVSIADNGYQIFFATNPLGYIYNTITNIFQQITDVDFPGATTVGYLDGYFVFNEPNSQKIWVTSLLEGTQIDPLDFASAEGSPDLVTAIAVDHRELWVFGNNSIEVWYNAGLADFPLQRVQGAFNEVGCISPYSIAKLDNSLFWIGADKRGSGIIYRNNGYTAQRISTHAIEWEIAQYSDITDAIGYTYQQEGHSFYVLNFPTANTTWVYDVATSAWHQRASFLNGEFIRNRGNCQVFYNNETIIGDYENGKLYTLDLNYYSDDAAPQKWLRSWQALPTGANDLKRTAHHSLQLNCESGVGLVSGQGSDPQVCLRWSDDSGHTWSNEHWKSMGVQGNYGHRIIWRRLGMTEKIRNRVYEISGTDPVKIAILGAELIMSNTNA